MEITDETLDEIIGTAKTQGDASGKEHRYYIKVFDVRKKNYK